MVRRTLVASCARLFHRAQSRCGQILTIAFFAASSSQSASITSAAWLGEIEEPAVIEQPVTGSDQTTDCNCAPQLADVCCCPDDGHSFSVFLGLEGSKQPQDFGVNAHFGGRSAVNWGLPISRPYGLGLQLGTAVNATANAVQVVERVEGSTGRTQSFTTVGVFQHTRGGLVWGGGYDFLYQDYYDEFFLGQWRGTVGYDLTMRDQVGVQASLRDRDDDGLFGATAVELRPITMGSVYYRHIFASGARLGGWGGVADRHSEANAALGDLPAKDNPFLFGSDVYVPLNNHLALIGEANFIMPSDTGTVDAYLGVEIYPWGGARRGRNGRFAPVLPVANSTSFAVDLLRQ
jgi:hypothetical protein